MSLKQGEVDDVNMGEIGARIKRIFLKVWARATRRIRFAVALISFL